MTVPLPEKLKDIATAHQAIKAEIGKVIVGQEEVIDQVLIAILARGHCLLLGVPGLAKTLLVRSLGGVLDLAFNRIQFTPDLMPSDITGTEILDEESGSTRRNLRFVPGPVFTNLLLADEINRTPPKTQAALLEAMQENVVTTGGKTFPIPQPFFVLATQNPIEQEGTYPLPEAQLDRFMFLVRMDYPQRGEEVQILRQPPPTVRSRSPAWSTARPCSVSSAACAKSRSAITCSPTVSTSSATPAPPSRARPISSRPTWPTAQGRVPDNT
mgnify:CR=1 FL=1